MQVFHNRPFALASCAFALTAVLLWQASADVKQMLLILAAVLLTLAVCCCFVFSRVRRFFVLAALCLVFIFAALIRSYSFFDLKYADLQKLNGTVCQVEGTVLERRDSAAYCSCFYVQFSSVNGEDRQGRAMLECDYASALQVGDRFSVTVTPRPYEKDELFDEEIFRLSDGCVLVLTCAASEDCVIHEEKDTSLAVLASRWNAELSHALRSAIGGESGAIASAFLLGDRSALTADSVLHFRRTGVSHLLALSGLHVSIIIGFLEWLLQRFRISKTVRAFLIPLCAVFYLALTGFSVSTSRAVLMVCVLYLAFLLQARYDAFTALSAVLVLILLFSPYAVLDLSLWLSFLAADSIIVFSPAVAGFLEELQRRLSLPTWVFRPLKSLITALAVGFAANASILLLSALVFGEISLFSIPATLLLTIPVTLLLILSFLLTCLPFLPILPNICALLGRTVLDACRALSNTNGIVIPVGDLPTRILLILFTVVLIFLATAKLRRKAWVILPIVLSVCIAVSSVCVTLFSPLGLPDVNVIPIGKGEVTLLTERGCAVLIANLQGASVGDYEIKQAMLDERCTEIQDLILIRYYNQATYFIASLSTSIRIHRLHLPTPSDERETAIAARLAQEAERHGICVVFDKKVDVEKLGLD